MELIQYIAKYLKDLGIDSTLTRNEEKTKANLYAVLTPDGSSDSNGGVMLSGHTDVVPTDGQDWTVDPFNMLVADGKMYGRGTTDMKGFIASVLAMIPVALERNRRQPIHLAFSYDEEIGCVGVRRMIDLLESSPERPAFCIVGEPTSLQVGIAHKGKTAAICRCTGVEGHSALATSGVNAIYLATELIGSIREIQMGLIGSGEHDAAFGVPYTTLHVGTIQGGTALNIIPNHCEFRFEIRNLKHDDPDSILADIGKAAEEIVAAHRENHPQVNIEIDVFNQYPALNTPEEEEIVGYVRELVDGNQPVKLDYGTEGGLFQTRLQVSTVVCGPGSMDQGHKPDEFLHQSELEKCDRFLMRLLDSISA